MKNSLPLILCRHLPALRQILSLQFVYVSFSDLVFTGVSIQSGQKVCICFTESIRVSCEKIEI